MSNTTSVRNGKSISMRISIAFIIRQSLSIGGLFAILFAASINSSRAQNSWIQKSDLNNTLLNTDPAPRKEAVSFSIGSKGYMGTGEDGDYNIKKDFWEYDPAANGWTQKADFAGAARYSAVGFSIGNKGYIGTGTSKEVYGDYFKDFWEYDPITNTWVQKADFGGGERSSAVGFCIGSKGYIGTGGYDIFGSKDFWEYDPISNTWVQKADFGGDSRLGAVSFTIGSKGYIGSGNYLGSYGYYFKDFWEYDPVVDSWVQKADFGGMSISNAVGFNIGARGYVGTGNSTNDFWEYDPSFDSWTKKADFGGTSRDGAVGFTISGKGYIGTGGYNSVNSDLWEYDPDTNSWLKKTVFQGSGRAGAVGFSIGTKGYLGTGYDPDSGLKKDFWEYDPAGNAWSQKADFGGSKRSEAVGFSIGSKGYIGTGTLENDFWEYDPATNNWTQRADFGGVARRLATGFSINNKGYIGTGLGDGYLRDFWEYDPAFDSWTQKADFGGSKRSDAVGFNIGSKGYIGTGSYSYYEFNYYYYSFYYTELSYRDFWEYNPDTDSWSQKADFGGSGRSGASGFSINNKGYIGMGYIYGYYDYQIDVEYSGFYKDFWEYDPATNTWISKADYGGVAGYKTVGFNIANKGYIGTGFNYDGYYFLNHYNYGFWEYAPDVITPPCLSPTALSTNNITTSSVSLKWQLSTSALSYKVRYKIAGTSEWTIIKSIDPTKTLHALSPTTEYAWQVKAICAIQPIVSSDWSEKQFFTTKNLKLSELAHDAITFNVYPNPVSSSATVSFLLNENSDVTIELIDVNGRTVKVIAKKNFPSGNNEITFDRGSMSAGIYLLQMRTGEGVMMKKLVIE